MTVTLYDLVGSDASRPFSPHCWKVRLALLHKGLPFETVPTSFTAIPAIESGVSTIIPVVRDGDAVVSDSFAIAEYLERTYPDRPTLFGGESGRASARFVEAYSNTMLHPLIAACAAPDIHDILDPAIRPISGRAARSALADHWRRCGTGGRRRVRRYRHGSESSARC